MELLAVVLTYMNGCFRHLLWRVVLLIVFVANDTLVNLLAMEWARCNRFLVFAPVCCNGLGEQPSFVSARIQILLDIAK